jgi:hypothetical protein
MNNLSLHRLPLTPPPTINADNQMNFWPTTPTSVVRPNFPSTRRQMELCRSPMPEENSNVNVCSDAFPSIGRLISFEGDGIMTPLRHQRTVSTPSYGDVSAKDECTRASLSPAAAAAAGGLNGVNGRCGCRGAASTSSYNSYV